MLERAYIGVPGASLRDEDRKKVAELVGLLRVIARVLPTSTSRDVTVVDAAAGKGYVGLATAALLVAPRGQRAHFVALERRADRVQATAQAFAAEAAGAGQIVFSGSVGDVGDATRWPGWVPDLVVALHACGAASDEIIAQAARLGARHVLVAPCCVAKELPAAVAAREQADALRLPRAAEIRRPFVESLVLASRVRALEGSGYDVMVDAFVAPTVTPYNKLIVARRIVPR